MSHEIIKDGKTYYPLTMSQIDIVNGEDVGKQYPNICMLFYFDTEINADVMENAVNTALQRMPTASLRRHLFEDKTNYKGKSFLQYFTDEPVEKIQRMSFKSEAKMKKYFAKVSQKAFPNDGQDIPLYEVVLIDLPDGKNALYSKMHHFINDAYGIMMFAKDVLEVYEAMVKGAEIPAGPESVMPAFEDQWDYFESSGEEKAQEYWDNFWQSRETPRWVSINSPKESRTKVKGVDTYGNQFNVFHNKAGYIALPFKKELIEKVNNYSMEKGVSPQVMFLLAYRAYLSKMNNNEERILLQGINAQRNKKNTRNTGGSLVMGFYFYTDVRNNEKFDDACKHIFNNMLEHYKYGRIQGELAKRKLNAQIPMDQIFAKGCFRSFTSNMFTYQPHTIAADSDVKFHMERLTSGLAVMEVYLTIMAMDNYSGTLVGCYDYAAYSLDDDKIKEFHNFMSDFLDKGINNPEMTLLELMK